MLKHTVGILLFILLQICMAFSQEPLSLNPQMYGLDTASSDIERYRVLLACHKDAELKGASVNYKGIDTIRIEIPKDFHAIPLCKQTDFSNVVIVVKNNTVDITLFSLRNNMVSAEQYDITKQQVIKRTVPKIKGSILVYVKDNYPWVEERTGYKYGHTRTDLLYIKSGRLGNDFIFPYTDESKIDIMVIPVNEAQTIISNLTICRDAKSMNKTQILQIYGQNRVLVDNVTINTPESHLYGDAAFLIENSANITFRDVTINGTYSQKDKFGYGISMSNVWNVCFDHLKANGNWGVFGCNNVNKCSLYNSEINRFDIHCYGKDVYFYNCAFKDLYNQFSSLYGYLKFEKCTFDNFIPVLIEASYNAYTPFDLSFKKCTFNIDATHNYLITLSSVSERINKRAELSHKCVPNISVKRCAFNIAPEAKDWYVAHIGGDYEGSFEYITNITMKNNKIIQPSRAKFHVFSKNILTTNKITYRLP